MAYSKYNSVVDKIKHLMPIEQAFELCFPGHKLTKRGYRLIAKCPFHFEKTPSFHLDTQKDRFKCFGCHVYGDSIDLYARTHNLSNREAIKQMAALLGISRDTSPEALKAANSAKARRAKIATMNQDIEAAVKAARNDCFDAEQWMYLFKKHIYTERDLERTGPIYAMEHLTYIEYLAHLFIYGSPRDQLEAVKLYRGWEACHRLQIG